MAHAQQSYVVTAADTAASLGSGDVPVLATPRLVAWLEAATVAALAGDLVEGSTSVGTHVDVRHLAASLVGSVVTVRAELTAQDGRTATFAVSAHQQGGTGEQVTVAAGEVTRVVVDRDRFLSRALGAAQD